MLVRSYDVVFARQPRALGTALLPPNAQHGAEVEDLAELDLKLMAKSLRETWARLRQDNLERVRGASSTHLRGCYLPDG
jgi:hypothetical protein